MRGEVVLAADDALARAGHPARGLSGRLGRTRESLLEGDVEWDEHARELELLIASLGSDSSSSAWAMHLAPPDADAPAVGRSQRDCVRELVTEVIPASYPLVARLEDRAQGFALLTLEIPHPRHAPRGFFEANVGVIEGSSLRLGAAGPLRVLDLEVSSDHRRAAYLLELRDEHARLPLGALGDRIVGQAVVPTLDMAELAGIDTAEWLAARELGRAAMLGGALVPWELVRALIDEIVLRVGVEGFERITKRFAELTQAAGETYRGFGDLASALEALHGEFLTELWGPFQPGLVVAVGPSKLVVRFGLRAGLEGSVGLFASHGGSLESMATHFGSSPGRILATLVDDDATGATYLFELPLSLREPRANREPEGSPTMTHSFVDEGLGSQRAARATVIEHLGHKLASISDVQSVADVLMDALFTTVELVGMEIDVATPEGALVPMRARGLREGSPIQRELVHGGERMGRLALWAPISLTGETVAALDLVVPWIAVAFGTALLLGRERRARIRAEEDAAGARELLNDVLLSHPHAVYVIGADGLIEAANAKARLALEQSATTVRALVAEAAGAPAAARFDVLPIRLAGRIERVLVVDRGGQPSHASRLALATTRWALTARQAEVVDHLCRGMTNKEIAASLDCAEVTVENHLTTIYRRTGLGTRTMLVSEIAKLA